MSKLDEAGPGPIPPLVEDWLRSAWVGSSRRTGGRPMNEFDKYEIEASKLYNDIKQMLAKLRVERVAQQSVDQDQLTFKFMPSASPGIIGTAPEK